MKRRPRPRRLLLGAVVLAAVTTGPAARVAGAAPDPPAVPPALEVDEGNKEFLVGHAVGVQVYRCTATPNGYEWGFVAPRARLYSDNGKLITTHFGGPTWQARDGSAVVAKRVDGVTVDPTAIPWLLLSAVSTAAGSDGDRLVHTTFIQRTETTGGLAPAAGECNADATGTTVEVPYTADYRFWKAATR